MYAHKKWGHLDLTMAELSTGAFRFTHNLNHSNYLVQVTPTQSGIICVPKYIGDNSFYIYVYNYSGSLVSGTFDFIVVGKN